MPATMTINELLEGVKISEKTIPELYINNVVMDSRKVNPGDLFVAIKGETTNGMQFIDLAEKNGACAVLADSADSGTLKSTSIPLIKVDQLKKQLPFLADKVYADPSASLKLIAITGTNGKTTCAHLIAQALDEMSVPAAVIGTVGQGMINNISAASLTTPDIFELRKLLAQFNHQGAQAVVFEASSHGLEQGRLAKLKLNLAVFTNLSQDHFDYHHDMDSYANAKLKLFQLPGLEKAVMNADCVFAKHFKSQTSAGEIWFYSKSKSANVRLIDVKTLSSGLMLTIQTAAGRFEFESQLIGSVNVENLLAVFTTLLACDFDEQQICKIFPRLKSASGRMEVFGGDETKPMVVIDYAHTPDALEKALHSLKDQVKGRLFCVFGCGGDRDKGKRSKMGAACEKYADISVVTDDNPRHESSKSIIADIVLGMTHQPQIINHRPAAIKWAIRQAREEDVILVAGKGHEATQQIGDDYVAMSDQVLVTQALEALV